ncbi:MAG: hypothetical protein LAP13_13725 [Acidobacteriia bacterium]|nr:hypothetical protein [Terriglobia bacterium]
MRFSSAKLFKRFFVASALLCSLCLATPGVASNSSPSVPVARSGKAVAVIVRGEAAGDLARYGATELQKYLRILSGAEIPVVTDAEISSRPAGESLILIGGPDSNKIIRDAGWTNFKGLKPEGFLIKTGRLNNHPAVIVGGNDDASVMYGAYDLIEQLGVTFELTQDIIPEARPDLSIPPLDLRKEPAFARRGFLLQDGGYENLSMFSLQDYMKLIDQMAKMKCNYIQFWWFSYEPWLRYSYKGEEMWMGDVSTKESGYLNWAQEGFGSRTTDDITVGKERFKGRRIAPPEMQQVETPDQAFDVAQDLLRNIIHYAKTRGIKVWLAVELAALPPNLARYCDRVGDLPFHRIFGTFVHPLDPVNREIQVNRFKALLDAYPEAEGYFFVFAEMYPELNTEKYHDFFTRERPAFHELRRLRQPWVNWGGAEGDDRLVDSNIGFTDLFKFMMAKRDEIAPHAKIGVMGIGRGYALPLLNKMLPEDIPFTDMESSGVWTPNGVPMEDFGGMGHRERTLEPRVDDDINMMGMQFSVRQYSAKDRIFTDGVKYGLTGTAGQLNRARGTETNSRFLAQAAWAPQLSAEDFYKEFSQRLFGERAAPEMYAAYMALEENEAYLGYYNYGYSTMNCCGALHEILPVYDYWRQDNPYDGPTTPSWRSYIKKCPDVIDRFEGSMRLLNQALERMRAALPNVAPQGKSELLYMINRTQAYHDYIQSLVTFRKASMDFDQSFKRKSTLSHGQFVASLDESLREFDLALKQVQDATRLYVAIIDHPSDLGVLYHLNARGILAFELSRQWMGNIVNFQNGKPYMDHVPFERIFSPDLHVAPEK